MVDRKTWFFISFLSAFFSVYCAAVLYSIFPTIFKMDINWAENYGDGVGNAFVTEMNATISGTAMTAHWLPLIGTAVTAVIVVSVLVGSFAMGKAMEV